MTNRVAVSELCVQAVCHAWAPRTEGREVSRPPPKNHSFKKPPTRHIDLLGAHDEVELQEIQIESGGQDADVARDLVTAGEDDGRLGEMVDLASPEHD